MLCKTNELNNLFSAGLMPPPPPPQLHLYDSVGLAILMVGDAFFFKHRNMQVLFHYNFHHHIPYLRASIKRVYVTKKQVLNLFFRSIDNFCLVFGALCHIFAKLRVFIKLLPIEKKFYLILDLKFAGFFADLDDGRGQINTTSFQYHLLTSLPVSLTTYLPTSFSPAIHSYRLTLPTV